MATMYYDNDADLAQRVRARETGLGGRQAGRSQAVAVAMAVKHLPSQRGLRLVVTQ